MLCLLTWVREKRLATKQGSLFFAGERSRFSLPFPGREKPENFFLLLRCDWVLWPLGVAKKGAGGGGCAVGGERGSIRRSVPPRKGKTGGEFSSVWCKRGREKR